jgi:hypothetical protein
MIKGMDQLFVQLLSTTELRKVDFKRDQYRLDNEVLKSKFIMDIVCIANAPGGDGYIMLGVESEKGKPRKVVGVAFHHDSSDLEAIVNGVIEEPIHFEYYPLKYQGKECALLFIPSSKARPHRPKRNYGILTSKVFYTRRASGNRAASIQEIREMCLETVRISDIAHLKAKSSPHIIDELADLDLDDRKLAMYKMLKSIAPKIPLTRYRSIIRSSLPFPKQVCVLTRHVSLKAIHEYAIFVYPWIAKRENIISSRYEVQNVIKGSGIVKKTTDIRARLDGINLIHISYKNIYTKGLEKRPFWSTGYWFANEWKEPWGRAIKWEDDAPQFIKDKMYYTKKYKYEFFLANVISKADLKERLEKLLVWSDTNIG